MGNRNDNNSNYNVGQGWLTLELTSSAGKCNKEE